ncbi:MAG: hypothetical protein ACPGU6_05850 [Tenacibaculum sp.]
MKNLVIGFLFLGLTSLSYAQNDANITLEAVTIKPLNLTYLKNVHVKDTPEVALALENEAARYDITEDPMFEKEFEAYEVVFSARTEGGSTGRITATYDTDGKILKSVERYKNVLLPKKLRNLLQEKYPGWIIHKDVYLVNYRDNKNTRQLFRVQIRKDGKRKNLKLDYDGFVN